MEYPGTSFGCDEMRFSVSGRRFMYLGIYKQKKRHYNTYAKQ